MGLAAKPAYKHVSPRSVVLVGSNAMHADSVPALGLFSRRINRESGRTPTLSDIIAIEPPEPKRPRGRPVDPLGRERQAIAARLIESGTCSRRDIEILVGYTKRAVNKWRAAHRRKSA